MPVDELIADDAATVVTADDDIALLDWLELLALAFPPAPSLRGGGASTEQASASVALATANCASLRATDISTLQG